ncbi:phage shock protein PspA [Paremcibacter congregatus]|jgi:phage shock protein A|uniref:Phage shock protein PspA n=1 Tax=Paremcibacter congregatus TaxID=2043170 RepID=A0A2G4YP49_9PROT|nr:phage shock protein PspA [Paremcibacter congregatus]PHZ84094.1 phage shock protein PspA [Paremcibacter congregatus]QDE25845.1 phage shock protein PspA [Paremcibacter congregatus]|tara:strand:+ start:255 stop:950 length:696 start_codon:yes stop_codon:yes gene_type:complete
MGIFTRLTDIVNSNINHILDKAEDPAKMIRMMVQEMEDTLVEVRSSAARVIADRKELERNMVRLQEAQDDWYAKAELALNKNREDLANAALIERSKLAELAAGLEDERGPLEEALTKYESDIISLEAKIKEAKQKQRSLVERQQSATSQLKVRQKLYDNRIGDVMVRFTQMEKRVDDTESRVEASELGREKSLSDEFADLEGQQKVADDLAALKAKMAKAKSSDSKPAAKK